MQVTGIRSSLSYSTAWGVARGFVKLRSNLWLLTVPYGNAAQSITA